MDDARFWLLIETLDGVAHHVSVGRLASELDATEREALATRARELADALLSRCRVPETHADDTADITGEHLAAAVVATGRESYRATLAAGGVLDPTAWDWEEAGSLLAPAPPEGTDALPAFVLRWLTEDLPSGVGSSWTADTPDLGDDPAYGQVVASDPAWDVAAERLLLDPAVARTRAAVGERFGASYDAVAVWLTLRDVEEPAIEVWPPADDDPDPQLVVTGTVAGDDLLGLTEEERTTAYLELVTGLLQVVLDG